MVFRRDSLMVCSIRTMLFVWHLIPSNDYKGLWALSRQDASSPHLSIVYSYYSTSR